ADRRSARRDHLARRLAGGRFAGRSALLIGRAGRMPRVDPLSSDRCARKDCAGAFESSRIDLPAKL
ncbi:hypothetical protein SB758_39525, partial [Burkholderia sp. SIMBA_013]